MSSPQLSTSVSSGNERKCDSRSWPFIRKRVYPSGAIGWIVDARNRDGGERRIFAKRVEAQTFADACRLQRQNHGLSAFGNEELKRYGKTVQDAVRFYLDHLRSKESSVSVKTAIEAFLRNRESRSDRYVSDLENRLGAFQKAFGAKTIGTLDADTMVRWLDQLPVSAVTRNTYRRRLAALFAFACERKWRVENPFAGGRKAEIKRIDEPRKKVKILFVDQAARLLAAASPETLPFWAIAIFAGLRPESELCRLRWEDIDFEQRVIVVDGAYSEHEETKTGRRVVKMSENLIAWLQPFARPGGPVAPSADP